MKKIFTIILLLSLSSIAVAADLSVSASSATVSANVNSTTEFSFTVKNTTTIPLNYTSSPSLNPEVTNNIKDSTCASSLAAGASCVAAFNYKPTAAGEKKPFVLTVQSASAGSVPVSATTTLTSTANATLAVSSNPSSGQLSANVGFSQDFSFTVKNIFTTPVTPSITSSKFSALEVSEDKTKTTCNGSALAVGASCVVAYTFHPTNAQDKIALQLTANDTAHKGTPAESGTMNLTATNTAPLSVTRDPSKGSVTTNVGYPTTFSFSITNISDKDIMPKHSVAILPKDVTETNSTCTALLGPKPSIHSSCKVTYTYTPTSSSSQETLNFTAQDVLHVGSKSVASSMQVSPTSKNNITVARTPSTGNITANVGFAQPFSFTATNTSTTDMQINVKPTAIPPEVQLVKDGCTNTTVKAGKSCTVSYNYTPTSTSVKGTFTVNAIDAAHPDSIAAQSTMTLNPTKNTLLTATASQANISTQVGISAPFSFTLKNLSKQTVPIHWHTNKVDGVAEDSAHNTCGDSLAAGQSCNVAFTYSPTKISDPKNPTSLTFDATATADTTSPVLAAASTALAATPASFNFLMYRSDFQSDDLPDITVTPTINSQPGNMVRFDNNLAPNAKLNSKSISINSFCPNGDQKSYVKFAVTNNAWQQENLSTSCNLVFDCQGGKLVIADYAGGTTCYIGDAFFYDQTNNNIYLLD